MASELQCDTVGRNLAWTWRSILSGGSLDLFQRYRSTLRTWVRWQLTKFTVECLKWFPKVARWWFQSIVYLSPLFCGVSVSWSIFDFRICSKRVFVQNHQRKGSVYHKFADEFVTWLHGWAELVAELAELGLYWCPMLFNWWTYKGFIHPGLTLSHVLLLYD